ncbi:MAG: ParB N-terminal domain-containing protein [Muribaculaceae bacterium]|nr:ParB N-terminal domain-containing protein [Muribaculaceae bacterium]
MTQNISIALLDYNKGQLKGLPKNPRFFRDYRYEAMKKSIEESPEMLELRELIVFPYDNGRFVVVCGNLRLRACKELGYSELPCKVLDAKTKPKKLREYATKDNVSFGETDMDILQNEWDKSELQDWGIEFAPEKEKDEFKERFDAITDDTALYPLIPKYDEKHELFIIQSASEVDSNWLRERLGMQRMRSYKTGKVSKSNVIDIKDVRHALEDSNPQPQAS